MKDHALRIIYLHLIYHLSLVRCQLLTGSGSTNIIPHLFTEYPPEFRETFSSQTLEPGPSLSLKCIAGGNPLPQITWKLDDAPLPESPRVRFGDYVTKDGLVVSYVNISKVGVEDGGGYSCRADNGMASVVHFARINIIGPPVVRNMRNVTTVAGEVFVIKCPVGGYPLESIFWERDGQRLPYNHRQKVYDNGTFEIHHVERSSDEGFYTCLARNKQGQTSQKSVFIQVKIKPVIEPFSFPKSLREGQRASVLCTVSSGDMPITLRWYKDDIAINELQVPHNFKGIRVNEVADYSSTLLFESLTLDHRGNYTCIASNHAGTASHTASMIIHVPPRWTVEPSDTSVVRGKSVMIDCATQGYPYPRITWTKAASANAPRDFKPIVSGPHLQVYENGSLSIQDARDSDAGYYLCQASNDIGQGLSKVVKISVHVAAHFKTKFTAEMVRKGYNIKLKCDAFGDKPIAITWTRDKQKIDAFAAGRTIGSSSSSLSSMNLDTRYELTESITSKGVLSEILIKRADRRDSSLFTCLASNAFGYDDTNIQLIVQEPPDPPQDVHLVEITSRSAKLSWSPPYSGNSPIIFYYIQYRSGTSNSGISNSDQSTKWSSIMNITIPSGETLGQIVGLKPATLYYFKVIAENHIGKSEPSRITEALTEEESPGGPPNNIKVAALSSRSVSVTWDPPNIEQRHGIIRGYYVGYKIVGSSGQFIYKTLDVREGIREEAVLTGLKQFTQYIIVVQAFNNKGAGPSSEEIKVQTLEMDAPNPPHIQVTSSSSSSIHLQWDNVHEDDNSVDGYILYQRQESSPEWKEIRIPGLQTHFSAVDLKCGTRYQFYLIAYNKIGRSEGSDIVTVKTDGSVPVAPDKASIVTVNSSYAVIHLDSWHHGGCPITKYKIRYRLLTSDGPSDWMEIYHSNYNDKQIEIRDLYSGTRYQLQITAYNDVGFTEAEYSFSSSSIYSDELSARSHGHSRGSKSSSSSFNEYSLLIPVGITILVILILLIVVGLVLRKNSSNGSIYGRKQDSLQMAHLGSCKSNRSTYTTPSPYNTPHNCQNNTETTTPKVNGDSFSNRLLIDGEPLYATVKRTPRAPRSEAHIYSYPIQAPISEMATMPMNDHNANHNNNASSSIHHQQSHHQQSNNALIVAVDEHDLEEKLLNELQHQCQLAELRHPLSIVR